MQKTILFFLMMFFVFAIAVDAAQRGNQENGRRIYQSFCSQCHGVKGNGTGRKGMALGAKPADHTDKEAMSKRTDAELYGIIWYGGKSTGLSEMMPSWRNALKEEDVWDIISYIRILCECNVKESEKK
ncbi:MAG: cytochrome c [Nitrospirae bacterium]|nr:cytochrome c [Nitrospirota bacterium]